GAPDASPEPPARGAARGRLALLRLRVLAARVHSLLERRCLLLGRRLLGPLWPAACHGVEPVRHLLERRQRLVEPRLERSRLVEQRLPVPDRVLLDLPGSLLRLPADVVGGVLRRLEDRAHTFADLAEARTLCRLVRRGDGGVALLLLVHLVAPLDVVRLQSLDRCLGARRARGGRRRSARAG